MTAMTRQTSINSLGDETSPKLRAPEAEIDAPNILKLHWDVLEDWVSKVNEDLLTDFAQTLANAFEKYGLFLELEEWTFDRELRSNTANTLFLEGSFASHIVHKLLFDDLGLKYLSNLTTILISKIVGFQGSIKNEDTKITEWTQEFLEVFDNVILCPVFLRESFLLIETKVNNRFSSHFSGNPFLLQYMFSSYICPFIRHPLKSFLPKEMDETLSPEIFSNLEYFSYFLNNLALNAAQSYEGVLKEFIELKHSVLVGSFKKLIDKENVEKAKLIVSWSTEDLKWTETDKEQALESLKDSLTNIVEWNNQVKETKRRQRNVAEIAKLLPSFESKLADPSWKKYQTTKFITFYKGLKQKSKGSKAIKGESKITLPLDKTLEFIWQRIFDKEYYPNLHKCEIMEEVEQEFNGKKILCREVYLVIKSSFPFSTRDLCLLAWKYYETPDRALILMNDVERPLKKGYIRAHESVSGWDLKFENGETSITTIWHSSSKAAAPKWVEDKLAFIHAKNMEKVISALFNENTQ